MWLKPDVAFDRGAATVGGAISLTLGFGLFDLIAGEVGVEPSFIDDRAKFEEDVVVLLGPSYSVGDRATAESSLGVTNFTGAIGPRTPSFCLSPIPGADNCWAAHAYFFVGESSFSGVRGIMNCDDCKKESLHFVGGTFIEPGLAYGLPSRDGIGIGVRTSFRHYSKQATVANEVRLGLELLFF